MGGLDKQMQDFYPRPPRGGRRWNGWKTAPPTKFLSTPSARRATVSVCWDITVVNFYPRPPRGGRRFAHFPRKTPAIISIHALREEGDVETIIQ